MCAQVRVRMCGRGSARVAWEVNLATRPKANVPQVMLAEAGGDGIIVSALRLLFEVLLLYRFQVLVVEVQVHT